MNDYIHHSHHLQEETHQYPSRSDFANIVQKYLGNLSFKKQDKALIDRQRYNLILEVLQEPKNTSVSTAQFRFWVKKMFQLVSMHTGRLVVCHDNKPVAVREQIYTIILWAHRQSNHGGRDKTSTLVRQRFSWIPKELIARFVRHCPFCVTRRNGQTNLTYSAYSLNFGFHPSNMNQSPPPPSDETNIRAISSSPTRSDDVIHLSPTSSLSSTSTRMENQSFQTTYSNNLAFTEMNYAHSMRPPMDNYDLLNHAPTSRQSLPGDYGPKQIQSTPFVNHALDLMPFF